MKTYIYLAQIQLGEWQKSKPIPHNTFPSFNIRLPPELIGDITVVFVIAKMNAPVLHHQGAPPSGDGPIAVAINRIPIGRDTVTEEAGLSLFSHRLTPVHPYFNP